MTYEEWFAQQDFYTNMRYAHGDKLFIKDGDIYRVLPVQIGYKAWNKDKATAEVTTTQERRVIAIHSKKDRDDTDGMLYYYVRHRYNGNNYFARSTESYAHAVHTLKELLQKELGWENIKCKFI